MPDGTYVIKGYSLKRFDGIYVYDFYLEGISMSVKGYSTTPVDMKQRKFVVVNNNYIHVFKI